MNKRFVPILAALIVGIGIGLVVSQRSDEPASARAVVDEHGHSPDVHNKVTPQIQDWCAEHSVPESECTQCNPALIAEFQANNDWCAEHGLPESHCRLCNPGLSFPQEAALTSVGLPEMSVPKEEIQTSVFYPSNVEDCATNHALIQFASVETASRIGLEVLPAISGLSGSTIEAPSELVFDETRTRAITSPITTSVIRWLVEPGTKVELGQPLVQLESSAMAELQSDFVSLLASVQTLDAELKRAESLHSRSLLSASEFEQIEARVKSERAVLSGKEGMLRACGLGTPEIDRLVAGDGPSPRYVVRSPMAGTLVERSAQVGKLISESEIVAQVGDPGSLWIEAQVRERDAAEIRVGMPLTFSVDGGALERVTGEIIWVSQFADPDSRTITVRAKPLGPAPSVRAGLFGRAEINAHASTSVTYVPRDAVQWEGCCNVVFVKEATDRFRPRKVTIERGDQDYYRVTKGLEPGEPIVVRGSYLLKTELKKSSLGAGCCGIDAPKGS